MEQLVYFPNGSTVTDTWIVNAKHIFDDIIVHDLISHTEMPPLLQADLEQNKSEAVDKLFMNFRQGIVNAAFEEMKGVSNIFQLPPQEQFIEDSNFEWDAFGSFKQSPNQSGASFQEQQRALQFAISTIDQYSDYRNGQSHFTRSCILAGAPGSGKSFFSMYTLLYVLSKGLRVCSTSVMAKRSNFLGGVHIHMFFQLRTKN